jgi:MYXO-CTERM domain-containing protein
MRSLRWVVLGAALVAVPSVPRIAAAEVWQDRYLPCPEPDGVNELALTASSHILYVNDCLPNGCQVRSGSDSSLTNSSSIGTQGQTVTMQPYMHGEAHFTEVIDCLKDTFAPFDIQVVTEDPGPSVAHFEVMAAGTSAQLNPDIMGAGGIAPFISCNAQRNNLLAFVFANQTAGIPYLCGAIAHEAGHVWGLSHSMDPLDPMTYMDLGSLKVWQNNDQVCGTDAPQNCRCFPDTQNSFRYLRDTFGLAQGLAEPTLVINNPKDGAWVKPGFGISATFTSPLETLTVAMTVDSGAAQAAMNGVLAWNAPTTVAPGPHAVKIDATDFADRVVSQTVNVKVTASCASGNSCDDGFHCLGGFCLPGQAVDGGLGATCADNSECITNTCSSDGTSSLCTGTCDANASCPSGFDCIDGANVCWPVEDTGCSATGSSGSSSLVVMLGAMLFGLRRRQRRG